MESESGDKARMTIAIDRDLVEWVERNIKSKRFATKTHAIEYALAYLRQEADGVRRTTSWTEICRLNEQGEVCNPLLTSPEDAAKRLFPRFDPVDEPAELDEWERETGFGFDFGLQFPYVYTKTVGGLALVIETDGSQNILRGTVSLLGTDPSYDPIEFFSYNLMDSKWPGTRPINVGRFYTLRDFAKGMVEHAKELNRILEAAKHTEKKAEVVE